MQDLGEETFPEPKESVEAAAAASPAPPTDSATSSGVEELEEGATTTPATEHLPETPQASSSSSPSETASPSPAESTPTSSTDSPQTVTTQQRKPLPIPPSVHVRITPETLKDYVGPPVYQKDRCMRVYRRLESVLGWDTWVTGLGRLCPSRLWCVYAFIFKLI